MAYVFRIHEPKKSGDPSPVSAASLSGWSETGHIAGGLLGNIPLGVNSGKMGTSIPSLFARIFLFEGAFQAVAGKPHADLLNISVDTMLISECLDMIEFLYQHGNDTKLVVKHWNAQNQINKLENDRYAEHTELANVIKDEVNLRPDFNDIFLFYWKDSTPRSLYPQEILIGGTSPLTMVFTTPNWKRKVVENNFIFNRLDGSKMFDSSDIKALSTRDSDFKNMLYSLRMAYADILGTQSTSFNTYIQTMWNYEPQAPSVVAMGRNPAVYLQKYTPIKDIVSANVMAYRIPICYEKIAPTASGYEIKPTAQRFAMYIHNGVNIQIQTPLALNDNGLPGVIYIGRSQWSAQNCNINEAVARGQKLHERLLPGQMGVRYPYLIWSDFLEDKIIKLPYKQNGRWFLSGSNGDGQYVLPLKREFFKYFNIEDINLVVNNIGGNQKKLVEITIVGDSVDVILNIPISDPIHRTIEFKKTYTGADIVADNQFVLAFFPFYRSTNPVLNKYKVMTCGQDVRLSFYKISNLDSRLTVTSLVRTPNQRILRQTEYYSVDTSFDLIEAVCGSTKGLIIPQMTSIDLPTVNFSFAVDFGTSNTYIAYSTNLDLVPKTFEIDESDLQTIFFNDAQGNLGELNGMKPFFAREFAPTIVGTNGKISYPVRTATCEIPTFERDAPELFSKISIGYNMQNEVAAANYFTYKTGLKWLLEQHPGDVHHTNRVKFYFLQILWMLKNKSLLNGGDDAFNVYITFPETMKVPTKNALMNQWNWAKSILGINCIFHSGTQYSESIAPYNSLASEIGGASFLNIDIGGGTSDLLFVCKSEAGQIMSAHYSSSLFAADDLWGDGVRVGAIGGFNNGFVTYIDREIQNNLSVYPSEIISNLSALKGITTSSADIMGFLFKHDRVFETSAKIASHQNLYSLIFIHYAALIYNVARLIKKLNIKIPAKLSFTGMGSKYINLISTDPGVVRRLTVLLLEKFTEQEVPNLFEILTNGDDVKEVTANGALIGNTLNPNFKIKPEQLSPVVDYGFDGCQTLTYRDVNNSDIRKKALSSFNEFVDSLKDSDFSNFLFNNFNITISDTLLSDLKILAEQSFVTMSASIPDQYSALNVTETLFFWPLKNSLVELSKKYCR